MKLTAKIRSIADKSKLLPIWPFKLQISIVLLAVLLIVSFFLRVNQLDYPFVHDTNRDYLVARHIAKYHEFPLTGSLSGVYGENVVYDENGVFYGDGWKNSPAHYYFLAGFLLIKDDILFLQLVNVFLQLFTLAMIYILAKKLFGGGTALITVILFGLSQLSLEVQNRNFWQPWTMQPFVHLSYVLLLFSYMKKKHYLLLLSFFFLIFAGVLHNSAFALLPIFTVLAFFILRKHKAKVSHYISTGGVTVFSFLLFFAPVLIYVKRFGTDSFSIVFSGDMYVRTFSEFFINIGNRISIVANEFFHNMEASTFSLNSLLLFLVLLCIPLYFFYSQKEPKRKRYAILTLCFVAQPIIFASLFRQPFFVHLLTPILGVFIIFISEMINSVFSRNIILTTGKVVLIVFLVQVFSFNFASIQRQSNFQNLRTIDSITRSIKSEIFKIQTDDNFEDINFFQMRVFSQCCQFPMYTALYWAALERDLNRKFTKVDDTVSGPHYRDLNSQEYIFLICENYHNDKECTGNFLGRNHKYVLVNDIYKDESFSVYVAKRKL